MIQEDIFSHNGILHIIDKPLLWLPYYRNKIRHVARNFVGPGKLQ